MSLLRHHKRRLSESTVELVEKSPMSTNNAGACSFPQLPEITGEAILETFSHVSLNLLRSDGTALNNERLSEVGRLVLDLAATTNLIGKQPVVNFEDIAVGLQ